MTVHHHSLYSSYTVGVAYFYVGGDRDQLFLLPVSMRDWLDEGHLAWFVIDVVASVDTAAFHARHPNDGVGRPAYDPDMMLALLFYAYATGLRSSRRIEAACRTDAAFRVIAGSVTPDHATIARFLVDHEAAIAATFIDVLRLCAAAGLVSVGTIAIDGTKIGADAALDKNQYQPMVTATQTAVAAAGVTDPIGMVLADAGYWSEHNATAEGPDRLIATLKDWKQRRAARNLGTTTGPPPEDASPLDAMEHRLRTPEGADRYALRSHTVEPVFGNHKKNRGQREFRRRGLSAVRSEWSLMNTVHNIAKLFDHHAGLAVAPDTG